MICVGNDPAWTVTGLPVGDWALKTNLLRYYEHDWAEPALSRSPERSEAKGQSKG